MEPASGACVRRLQCSGSSGPATQQGNAEPLTLGKDAGNISLIFVLACLKGSTSSPPSPIHDPGATSSRGREIPAADWLEHVAAFPEAMRNLGLQYRRRGYMVFARGEQARLKPDRVHHPAEHVVGAVVQCFGVLGRDRSSRV